MGLTARTFKGGHTKNRTGIPRTVAYGLRRNGRAIPAGPPYRCNWGIFLATRVFRTDRSIFAEEATRGRVQALLERHGITVTGHRQDKRGSAIIQVIEGHIGDGPPMRGKNRPGGPKPRNGSKPSGGLKGVRKGKRK